MEEPFKTREISIIVLFDKSMRKSKMAWIDDYLKWDETSWKVWENWLHFVEKFKLPNCWIISSRQRFSVFEAKIKNELNIHQQNLEIFPLKFLWKIYFEICFCKYICHFWLFSESIYQLKIAVVFYINFSDLEHSCWAHEMTHWASRRWYPQ